MSAIRLRDGWVMWSCDHPTCEESVEFRPTLEETAAIEVRPTPGEAEPEDWVVDLSATPGKPGSPPWHYCPAHAEERTA
jgi:hypothetical protein